MERVTTVSITKVIIITGIGLNQGILPGATTTGSEVVGTTIGTKITGIGITTGTRLDNRPGATITGTRVTGTVTVIRFGRHPGMITTGITTTVIHT